MQKYLFLALFFVLSVTLFAIQNSQQITLKFLYWEFPSFPLVMLILFSAATGALISLLFSVAKQLKMTAQLKALQAQIKQMEKKIPREPEKEAPPTNNTSSSNHHRN